MKQILLASLAALAVGAAAAPAAPLTPSDVIPPEAAAAVVAQAPAPAASPKAAGAARAAAEEAYRLIDRELKVARTFSDYGGLVAFTVPGMDLRKTIDLDLNDAPVRDAVKQILELGAKDVDVVIEGDVPEEARVTLRAKGVRLGTALDLVTQAAGVNWVVERNGKERKTAVHVGKKVRSSISPRAIELIPGVAGDARRFGGYVGLGGGGAFSVTAPRTPGPAVAAPRLPGLPLDLKRDFIFTTPEVRSTFQCPHCKGRTTLIRSSREPDCTRCARTFQPEWQFCPVDGAKRPPSPNDFQFCPMCGKRVEKPEKELKGKDLKDKELKEEAKEAAAYDFFELLLESPEVIEDVRLHEQPGPARRTLRVLQPL